MTTDTEILHVTKAGANLFLELGFAPAEAKKLQAALRKQINDTRALKQQLMRERRSPNKRRSPGSDGVATDPSRSRVG